MSRIGQVSGVLSLLMLTSAPVSAQRKPVQQPRVLPSVLGQEIADRVVTDHKDVTGIEMAVESGGACKTIAATDPNDVGTKCDADEIGPMRTGEPNIEEPTTTDPVYDITFALHDATGRLIGAVGMDVKPGPRQDRASVLAHARVVLREIEAQIPSLQTLLEARSR